MKIHINNLNKDAFCMFTDFNPNKNGIVNTKKLICNLDHQLCNCKTCGLNTGFNRNNNG